MRDRFAAAQASAITFEDVIDQGEVVHWMSAISPILVPYGTSLQSSGYKTLYSIAMLCEEDLDNTLVPPNLKVNTKFIVH